MARKSSSKRIPQQDQPIPPGATKRASDRDERPGGPPHSRLDDRHAAGTPGGGTEVGGLAGTNRDDGDPDIRELHEAMATGEHEPEAEFDDAYGGVAGGAVGGTPARKRSTGGRTRGGLKPGGVHRGDSTIGSDPESRTD